MHSLADLPRFTLARVFTEWELSPVLAALTVLAAGVYVVVGRGATPAPAGGVAPPGVPGGGVSDTNSPCGLSRQHRGFERTGGL